MEVWITALDGGTLPERRIAANFAFPSKSTSRYSGLASATASLIRLVALWASGLSNEPDWLCAVEFLNDEDPEGRDLAAGTTGYLLGYAHLTNTRSLAPLGDPSEMAYGILFSFSSPVEKKRFLDLIGSNDDLGSDYIDYDLVQLAKEEIRDAQPLARVLPQRALTRALLVATMVCSPTLECRPQ